MKTNLPTSNTGVWEDPALSAEIEAEHRKLLEQAMYAGTTDELRGKPAQGDRLEVYIGFLNFGYNACKAKIQQKLEPGLQRQLGGQQIRSAADQENEDHLEIARINSLIRSREEEKKDEPALWGLILKLAFGLLGLVSIIVGDYSFLSNSLAVFQSSNRDASFIAWAISIALAIAVHALVLLIPRITNITRRKLAAASSIGFGILLFCVLAYVRVVYFGFDGSPLFFILAFVCFNALMMFGIWFVASKFLIPGFSSLAQAIKSRNQRKKTEQLRKQVMSLENGIKQRKKTLDSSLTDKMALHASARSLDRKVDAFYKHSVATYIRHNIEKRRGPAPECFNDPIPPLDQLNYEMPHQEEQQ